MAEKTTKLDMGYIVEGQQGNDVTFSDNMNIIDSSVHISVKNQITSASPTSPSNGDAYIVAPGGTGDFALKDGEYAYYHDQWYFMTPRAGWLIYDEAQDAMYYNDGASFLELPLSATNYLNLNNKVYSSMTTGIVSGCEVTINGVDNTKFDVAPGEAIFVNHDIETAPTWTKIEFLGLSSITATYLGTAGFTALYLESNGTITQDLDALDSPLKRRTKCRLGTLIHGSLTQIDDVTTESHPAYDGIQNLSDMVYAYGAVAVECYMTPNGANLKIDRGVGSVSLLWCNIENDNMNPNNKTFATAETQHTFAYQIRDGAGDFQYITGLITDIDPDYYDDGTGIPAAVPTDYWSIQRPYFSAAGEISTIRLGQAVYATYEEAIANLEIEEFTRGDLQQVTVNTTRIIVKQGATDLSDTDQAFFIKVNRDIPQLPTSSVFEIQSLLDQMNFTGFHEWFGTGTYYTIVGGNSLTIDRAGDGWINGRSISWQGAQNVALTQYKTNYIFIDSDGLIVAKTDAVRTDYINNIALFEAYYDGGVVVVRENHPVAFPSNVSGYSHKVIGSVLDANGAVITRVATGTGAAAGDREIKIVGEGAIYDHGIEDTIADSGGAGVSWITFYKDASARWIKYNTQTQLNMYYNNAGTPTLGGTASNTGWIINTLYVTKCDLNSGVCTYIAVMDTAQYASLALAEAAINAGTFEQADGQLANLELAQLGYVILKNNVSGGYVAEVQISKVTLNAQAIAQQGNTAVQISCNTSNFDGMLSTSDTPVQTALETIDEFGKSSGFEIKEAADLTKTISFDLTSITTATNRTIKIGDTDIDFSSPTDTYVLTYDLATNTYKPLPAPGASGGEVNTASNKGTDGVGVFDVKNVYDLEFRNIAPASSKVSVVLNGKDIDLDIVESAITHGNLGGITDHVPNFTLGTPAVTTQYNLQVTAAGVKSWVEDTGAAGGGGLTHELKTVDFTVAAGKRYLVDSASVVVATLPASWTVGDEFEIVSNQSDVQIKSGATGQSMYIYPEISDTSTASGELLATIKANKSAHWYATTTLKCVELEQGERAIVAQGTDEKVYAVGGRAGGTNTTAIDGLTVSTDTSFVSSATLGTARRNLAGVASSTHGYCLGGYTTTSSNAIDGIVFATDAANDPLAALSVARYYCCGYNSSAKGFAVGGNTPHTTIDGIVFSGESAFTASDALDTAANRPACCNSSTRGYAMGGTGATTAIQYLTFSNEVSGTSSDVLTTASSAAQASESSTKGYLMNSVITIEGVVFATDANFSTADALDITTTFPGCCSSNAKGYALAGQTNSTAIQGIVYSTEVAFTSSASLNTGRQDSTAFEKLGVITSTEYDADYNTVNDTVFAYIPIGKDTVQEVLEVLDLNTMTDQLNGLIESVADQDYTVTLYMPFDGTITATTTQSLSGTCTATFKIGTTALGGTANSVSSTIQTRMHSSSNSFFKGDSIKITVSANSACVDFAYTITFKKGS